MPDETGARMNDAGRIAHDRRHQPECTRQVKRRRPVDKADPNAPGLSCLAEAVTHDRHGSPGRGNHDVPGSRRLEGIEDMPGDGLVGNVLGARYERSDMAILGPVLDDDRAVQIHG
jgi:hypothetical protein